MQTISTEYLYDEPEDYFYGQTEVRSCNRFAEIFVLFLWTMLCWEGVFGQYFREALPLQEAWWMRLTPWYLYPSELIFYNPIFLIVAFFITLMVKSPNQNARGLFLLMILIGIGVWGMVYGLLRGAPGRWWLQDFRQSFLMSIFVPMFAVLSGRMRLDKFSLWFCRLGIIATVYCGIAGILVFSGVWGEFDRHVPFWHGSFVLILMYILMVTRYILTGKKSFLLIMGLAFGILAPLHKPAIGAFIIVNFMTIAIVFFARRRYGGEPMLRSIFFLIFLGLFGVVLLSWVLTLGQGAALEWIQVKFLKMHVAGGGDLSGSRFELWRWGFYQWLERPFLGSGYGFWYYTSTGDGTTLYVPIHNTPIEVLYELGVLGFIPIVTICILWLKRVYKFIKECSDTEYLWPYLGMFIWVVSMLCICCYGKNLGLTSVGFIFWSCIGFLSHAEARWYYENDKELYTG